MTVLAFIPALMALALWVVTVWLSGRRTNRQTEFDNAENGRDHGERQQPIRPPSPTNEKGWHAEEREHRRQERRYWLAYLVLTLAVAIGAGFSARYAYEAAAQARKQVVVSQEANRMNAESGGAWIETIDASVEPTTPAVMQIRVINVGREPARNFGIAQYSPFNIDAKKDPGAAIGGDANRSDCMSRQAANPQSVVIFPGIENDRPMTSEQWVEGQQPGYHTGTKQFTAKIPSALVTSELSDKKQILVITGCVAYISAGKVRHTAYCFYWTGPKGPVAASICGSGNDAD